MPIAFAWGAAMAPFVVMGMVAFGAFLGLLVGGGVL
jgi:hypothetical protein